jgi:Spy/CpxP family protein refolding chaperone
MIRTLKHPRLSIFLLAMFCLPVALIAQDSGPDIVDDARSEQAKMRRPDLFRELGLSEEQMQTLRRLNMDRKPVEQQARRRFQEASRELNFAIYADAVNDAVFQARLKDFQDAQAELARIKFSNELAVRKILTPEQLGKFRELRRRFAEARENMKNRPGQRRGQPALRRLRRANPPLPK